jgi:hypothetical protein
MEPGACHATLSTEELATRDTRQQVEKEPGFHNLMTLSNESPIKIWLSQSVSARNLLACQPKFGFVPSDFIQLRCWMPEPAGPLWENEGG